MTRKCEGVRPALNGLPYASNFGACAEITP